MNAQGDHRASDCQPPTGTSFQIEGPVRLDGCVSASGSKNAALPMMAAAILADGRLRLEGVPRLSDVDTLAQVLLRLGLRVDATPDGLTLETVDARPVRADYDLVSRMRASFCVLGPLLARRGRAEVALPGGCNIGDRPVDLHLKGLAALGADLEIRHGYVIAQARRLRGAAIDLAGPRGPTVTGTANVLCAAVLAEGTTVIRGAAREPEIVDLGNMLCTLGADISGLGTPTLRIEGVARLNGGSHRVTADRIEVATILMAAAITRGRATVCDAVPAQLEQVLATLRRCGIDVEAADNRITVSADGPPRPIEELIAEPYPGIPSDLQAQWMALLSLAPGKSRVCDRVFPARFMHAAELNRLGARIACRDGAATIEGVTRLTGSRVRATDLRASAALVLAGLAAEGQTIVDDAQHLDRGYQRLDEKLNQLGARVRRRSASQAQ